MPDGKIQKAVHFAIIRGFELLSKLVEVAGELGILGSQGSSDVLVVLRQTKDMYETHAFVHSGIEEKK